MTKVVSAVGTVAAVPLRLIVAAVAIALILPALARAAPPNPEARAFLVVNASTGEVLAARAPHARVPIASITKLMTVLVALEHTKLSNVVRVDRNAAAVGESTINLRAGERITVHDLVAAALIQSANDAAVALARYVGHGSTPAFIALMNAKARQLGLHDTHFVRPDGLDEPGEVSSAADVVKLAEVAMHNPTIRRIVGGRTAIISGDRHLTTWDDLLGTFPGLIGVKTGHTDNAGWCQVAAVRGDGLTIYTAILGSPTRSRRNADLSLLLDWGLSRYRVTPLVQLGRTYASARIGYGRDPVALVAQRPLVRSVRLGRPFVERVTAPAVATMPVAAGQVLGAVRIYQDGRLVGSRPLVAAKSVSRPGLTARVGFYAGRTVHRLWGWVS
jgi:serine-type D-Ala-D-Ala carboxypeptidase (penicillin-binding protein 5/6)